MSLFRLSFITFRTYVPAQRGNADSISKKSRVTEILFQGADALRGRICRAGSRPLTKYSRHASAIVDRRDSTSRVVTPALIYLFTGRAGILIYPKESAHRALAASPSPPQSPRCTQKRRRRRCARRGSSIEGGGRGRGQIKHDITDKCQKQNLDTVARMRARTCTWVMEEEEAEGKGTPFRSEFHINFSAPESLSPGLLLLEISPRRRIYAINKCIPKHCVYIQRRFDTRKNLTAR